MKKKHRRWIKEVIGKVFRTEFFLVTRGGASSASHKNRQRECAPYPPKTPGKEHLYEPKQPYGPKNEPPSREAALERRAHDRELIADWRRRHNEGYPKGMGPIYDRVVERIRRGKYDDRQYDGRVEPVMAAVCRELQFLELWLESAKGREPRPERRLAHSADRSDRRSGQRPPWHPPPSGRRGSGRPPPRPSGNQRH